jgi:hypothetical protein
MSCPGDNYIVPGANPCAGGGGGGVAGVSLLNNQSGVVNIVPSNGTIVVTQGGGQIGLEAVLGGNVVTTLNGIIDDVNITGTGLTVTPNLGTKTINLSVPSATVTNITGSGVATVSNVGTVFNVSVPTPPSATVTNVTGSGIATVTPTGTVFDVSVPAPSITSVTGSGYATVTPSGTVFDVNVPLPTVTAVTGTGVANVTNVGTTFNVDVPVASVLSIVGTGIANVTSNLGAFTVDVPAPVYPVESVNTLTGALTISSADNSITITSTGTDIDLSVVGGGGGGVPSLNGLSGVPLSLVSADSSVTITPGTNEINLSVLDAITGVVSLNGENGELVITSNDGSLIVTTDPTGIDIKLSDKAPFVDSLNGLDGDLVLTSSDGSITIAPSGLEINLTTTTGLDKLIANDPIQIDQVTNPGFFTIYSTSPRIISFFAISDINGLINYNFITDKVIPQDTNYAVIKDISFINNTDYDTRLSIKTVTDVQITVVGGIGGNNSNVPVSVLIALFNYKPFVRKTVLIPFAPMPQTITVSNTLYVNIPFTLPADFLLINNANGPVLTMYFSGQWTAAESNKITYGLYDDTSNIYVLDDAKTFGTTPQDFGTELPSSYSQEFQGIIIDESNTYSYHMELFVAPPTPIDFVGHGMAIQFEYWGFN